MTNEADAKAKQNGQPKKEGPGGALMDARWIVVVVVYIVLSVGFVVYSLVALWPPIRPAEVEARLKALASPTPTPSPTASPSPTATPTPTPSPTPTPTPASTASPGAAQTTPSPTPTVSPTPTGTPSPSPGGTNVTEPDCEKAANIREGFCLNEKGEPRPGIGAVRYFFRCYCMYDEDRLMLIVLLCGALGALVHGVRSLSWYVGNRQAIKSWTAWYVMLPFFGAALAFIFYLVIRGGFFSPTSTVSGSTSPFGFAAMSALIGMFSEPALNKLKNIAFTLFEPPEKGKDHVTTAMRLGVSPPQGVTTGGEKVTLTGTGFTGAIKVTFGGRDATVLSSSETSVVVETPAHDKGKVDVVLTNGDGQQHTAKEAFEYTEPPNNANAGDQPANNANTGQPANNANAGQAANDPNAGEAADDIEAGGQPADDEEAGGQG